MKLLVDTDAFCKLAVAGLLLGAVRLLGADLSECGRLPALPHMLRKGRLRRTFGAKACDDMVLMADAMPISPRADDSWLDRLTSVPAVDPGEAQLFAAAAENGFLVLSGDKRALRALKDVAGFSDGLAGRIVTFDAILISLCEQCGAERIRRRVSSLEELDQTIKVCFSSGNARPQDGLLSYHLTAVVELKPLVLWNPHPEARS